MNILSPHASLFDDVLEDAHPVTDLHEIEMDRHEPGRGPVYAVETLLEGRSAWEAVLEDARPFVRR